MSTDIEYWNDTFERVRRIGVETMTDHWLTPYVPMMRGQNVQRVLEIGCGSGADTKFLVDAGFEVTATDFSANALSLVRDQLPDVRLLLHDTREPFPFGDGAFDMVVASLSLHYFDAATTEKIICELKRLLRSKGLLLYRMNATSAPACGVGQGDLLEDNFYLQDGIRRRYYSIDSCRLAFHGWEELLLEEKTVAYFGKQKALCEGFVRKTT